MANRTSMGPGLAITIGLLAVATVGFFVTTILAVADARNLETVAEDAKNAEREALGGAGRDATWERYAQLSGSQGVVPFLADENGRLIRMVGGSASRDTADTMQERIDEFVAQLRRSASEHSDRDDENADDIGDTLSGASPSLLALMSSLETSRQNALTRAGRALNERDQAVEDRNLANEQAAIARRDTDQTVQRLQAEIDAMRAELDGYRESVSTTTAFIEEIGEENKRSYDASLNEFRSAVRDLEDKNAQLQDQIRRLSGENSADRLMPQSEAALIDARVVNINPDSGEVYLDRGRVDRVVLGMTFEIYGDGVSVRPDERGEFPRGKATVEVIRIDDTTCAARILTRVRGNPVLPGDKCVNAVWDPNKEYRFVVFGNFDVNFDGIATPAEKADIEAVITDWGGILETELTGRTDFVVLGERPILPPAPREEDPFPVVDLYLQKLDIVEGYNLLFNDAGARSIPVLNQNRLYTLTGLDNRPE